MDGSGPLEPLHIALKDPTARDYNGEPGNIPAAKTWGGPGNGPGQFSEPRGLATDTRGTLYVADTKNSRIQVFDGTGQFVKQFGTKGAGLAELNEPCGVAVDAQGDLWVADTWNGRIVHYNAEGLPSRRSAGRKTVSSARAPSSCRRASSTWRIPATNGSCASIGTGKN